MTRAELLSHKEYRLVAFQLDLYARLETYMAQQNMSRTQLADQLGVTKGYVSQILNGDFDHKISKLVELSLAIGLVPTISYQPIQEVIEADKNTVQSERELIHA